MVVTENQIAKKNKKKSQQHWGYNSTNCCLVVIVRPKNRSMNLPVGLGHLDEADTRGCHLVRSFSSA
jgi:hypothetical protein